MIGINQQIETESGANDGVGFAVPVSAIKRSVAQLEEDGEVEYAYIGVSSQALYPQLAERARPRRRLRRPGRRSRPRRSRRRGGPARAATRNCASRASPTETGGDVILAVDGRKVVRPDDLARYIASFRPGEEVTLEVLDEDGEREDVEVDRWASALEDRAA